MYFLVCVNGKENKKAKGFNKNVVEGTTFIDVLFKVNCIKSELTFVFLCL